MQWSLPQMGEVSLQRFVSADQILSEIMQHQHGLVAAVGLYPEIGFTLLFWLHFSSV